MLKNPQKQNYILNLREIEMAEHNEYIAGDIRNSQLVTTYGCGALCDFPGVSGIISEISDWNTKNLEVLKEPNLEDLLGVKEFKQIISDDDGENFHIPIYRFPEWYYCPKCGRLDSYKSLSYEHNKNKILYCEACYKPEKEKVKLNPSRFIVACANGHLDDFPYMWWVHKGKEYDKNKKHELRIEFDEQKEGLEGIKIKCSCGAEATMQGCLSADALKSYHCKRKRPWIKNYKYGNESEEKECKAIPRTLLRSGNNVYYPITVSAITLPDAESVKDAKDFIENNKSKIEQNLQNGKSLQLYYQAAEMINELSFSENIFVETYNRLYKTDSTDSDFKSHQLLRDEYNALCEKEANDEDKNFKIKEVEVPVKYKNYISKIRLVKKLREVQVLKGFNRILPEFSPNDGSIRDNFGIVNEPYYVQISDDSTHKNKANWLPAIQLIGEGIFIELNQNTIQEWEEKASVRYAKMKKALETDQTGEKLKEKFSEQYVLLHTLSHLLIRQLAYDCGYNTASLKEKIYSTLNILNKSTGKYERDKKEMAGILIYTASSDSDGSLGGLVRQGETENFERLMDNTLENAYWCSNDPVCCESKNQGYRSLNYAACHACALLPETSCEAFNTLLDRASVIGIPGDEEYEDFGFFDLEELKDES